LAFIFALNEESFSVRTCAGLILKNNLVGGKVDKNEQAYVKNQVVKAIGDPDPTVRRTAGSLITSIIGVFASIFLDLPLEVLEALLDGMAS
jgi:hypothetical protein